MKIKRSSKLFFTIWVFVIIVSGCLVQAFRLAERIQSNTLERTCDRNQHIHPSSGPELKLQWSINTSTFGVKMPNIIWGLASGDGNGDGLKEIAVVEENGTLLCINGINGSLLWKYFLKGFTYSVTFGDVNGDNREEVITTRNISSSQKNITVFDFDTHEPITGYSRVEVPAVNVIGVGSGNIKNDSKSQVLFLLNRGDLYIFKGDTNETLGHISPIGEMIPSYPPYWGGGANKRFDINLGDVDGDGIMEFLVCGINIQRTNGITSLYRWQSVDDIPKLWNFTLNSSAYCSTGDFGDIDGDGKAEVIVGTRQNDLVAGGTVFCLNGENATILWQFDTGSNNVYDISCGDLDADGKDEIAIAVGGTLNYTYILDGETHQIMWGIPSPYPVMAVDVVDMNNDGKCEIITVGGNLINLYCIDTDADGISDMDDLDDDNDTLSDWQEQNLFHTNQFLLDSDFDNLTDPMEIFTYRTFPNFQDSDFDNLTDWQELFVYHTYPNSTNTDGDFLTDWQELYIYHTDPRNPDSDGDGFLDGEPMQIPPYELFIYQIIAFTATNLVFLAINIRYFLKFRRIEKERKPISKKAETIRKLIEEAVWYWGHGPQILKNFDNLVAKNVTTITLETLTRTWTQHYKRQFQKISHLSEEESLERAEQQKKQDIIDLYNLLKEKIDVKVVPITFGKYAGSDSYQFEISDTQSEKQKQAPKTN